MSIYCKSKKNRENFIFANSVKRHICDATNSRLGHDLRIFVNNRVILAFRVDLFSRNIAYAKFHENKTLAKISLFTITYSVLQKMFLYQQEWEGDQSNLVEFSFTAVTALWNIVVHFVNSHIFPVTLIPARIMESARTPVPPLINVYAPQVSHK